MQKVNIHIGTLSLERRIQIAFVTEVNFDPRKLQAELRERASNDGHAFPLNPSYVAGAIQVEADPDYHSRYILTYGSNLDEGALLKVLKEIEADVLGAMRAERLRGLVNG